MIIPYESMKAVIVVQKNEKQFFLQFMQADARAKFCS